MSSWAPSSPRGSPPGSAGGVPGPEPQGVGGCGNKIPTHNNLNKEGSLLEVLAGGLTTSLLSHTFPPWVAFLSSCRWGSFRGPGNGVLHGDSGEAGALFHIQGGPDSAWAPTPGQSH